MTKKIVKNFCVMENIFKDFKKLCDKRGRSVSTSIEDLLIERLEKEERNKSK